ncbi:hypothetical protein D3C76_1122380 [compost metagenome]
MPEPLVGDEPVEGILQAPVIGGNHIVLEFTVVFAFRGVPPSAVACRGLEVDVVIVGVFFRTLIIQRGIDIALPHQVLDHRFGLEDLLDTGQLNGLGRITVGQGDLAILGRLQRFGLLAGVGILLDQELLVTLQGLDLFPVDGNRTGVIGLDQQLAAIENGNLATEFVPILQPDSVGKQGHGGAGHSQA